MKKKIEPMKPGKNGERRPGRASGVPERVSASGRASGDGAQRFDADFHPVAARVLGPVEGLVGQFDHRGRNGAVQLGHAEAAGDVNRLAVMRERLGFDRQPQSFGQLGRAFHRSVRQQDRELFAAVAADDVLGSAVWR